ncbi:MAG: GNAT family N-acetyltransferase [Pseudomonadota bacterium]
MTATIRTARAADRDTIASIHAQSWKSAYRDVFPEAFLAGPVDEHLLDMWRAPSDNADDVLFVAEENGANGARLVGFIAVRCRPDPFIENLHVLPAVRSQGLGRRLMGRAAERLIGTGQSIAHLWVMENNTRAIRFYEALGGVRGETVTKVFFGNPARVVRIDWTDLSAMAGAAE